MLPTAQERDVMIEKETYILYTTLNLKSSFKGENRDTVTRPLHLRPLPKSFIFSFPPSFLPNLLENTLQSSSFHLTSEV